jgi:hypothetical protein
VCSGKLAELCWFAYNSGGSDVQTPPPNVAPTRPDPIQPPRGSSAYAMHTYGTFSNFLGLGCSLNGTLSGTPEIPSAYDVSAYTGISFYAKGTPLSIQVIVATTDDVPAAYGGTCNPSAKLGEHLQSSST